MNDRFKFRCWDKENKCMHYPGRYNNFSYVNGVVVKIESYFTSNGVYRGKKLSHEFDDAIILQCTGLKDKNGKLIYELDYVRYAEYEIDDIEPEWEYDEIVWGGKHSYPAFDLANNQFECNGLSYIINEGWTIEVIGNKFENPELLKECE